MRSAVLYLLRQIKQDRRYWQFPLALSAITVSAIWLRWALTDSSVPAWLVGILSIQFVGISCCIAWLLLLSKPR